MTPFDDEQRQQVRLISEASHAHGAAGIAKHIIAVAARAYFEAYAATDSEAMNLCDIIMGVLGQVEQESK